MKGASGTGADSMSIEIEIRHSCVTIGPKNNRVFLISQQNSTTSLVDK
jgi:hypothetical protein